MPDPSTLAQYPPEVQRAIIDWAERRIKASFDDESARQDRLVDAEISKSKAALALSFLLDFALIVGAFVTFAITGDTNVFWVFTVLGASVIGNVVVNIRGRRNKDE